MATNVPFGAERQDFEPGSGLYVPAEQVVHIAALSVLDVPAGHGVHESAPLFAFAVPAGQGRHAVLPDWSE